MEQYPSISTEIIYDLNVEIFPKLDGSNFRCEWNSKKGFYKFGTRNFLVDSLNPQWVEAQNLIIESSKFLNENEKIQKLMKKSQKIVFFYEFWGANSFAGSHYNEPHMVTLIDIHAHKRGILPVLEFLDLTKDLSFAVKSIYSGKITPEIVEQIKDSKFPGATFEGVVAKGSLGKQNYMFKIKTDAWIKEVRSWHKSEIAEKLI